MKRPKIPNVTKRNVRKRCGYGCVICGMPIFDYDHMIPWSAEKQHRIDNITLLCPNHHAEKTKGLIDTETIIAANKNPRNKQSGMTSPYQLRFNGQDCIMVLGDQLNFKASKKRTGDIMIPIQIDSIAPISFRFEGKNILLNIRVLDDNNKPCFIVQDGEMIFSVDSWDVEFVGRRLKIRKKLGVIVFDVEFSPPNKIILWKSTLDIHGHHIDITDGKLIYKNLTITGKGKIDAAICVNIGENKTNLGVGIQM